MNDYTLDEWWSSLTVPQKIRIGRKITHTQELQYPECTYIWSNLSVDKKQTIHDHCVDRHGHTMTEWTEGETYSY